MQHFVPFNQRVSPSRARPLISLQYLRGVAALLIVLFHLFNQLRRLGYSGPTPDLLQAGVDIFFVISGFIMWYTTYDSGVNAMQFMARRIVRIVPLYWLVTTFYLVLMLVRPEAMMSARFSLSHVVYSYLFIPTTHPVFPQHKWPLVIAGWSLNYEMFFYLLYSFSLRFQHGFRALIIIMALCLFASMQVFDLSQEPLISFFASDIILEFGFGILLGCAFTSGIFISRSAAVLMTGAAIIAWCASPLAVLPRSVAFGIPAFLLVGSAVLYERGSKVAEFHIPKLLGDASYSIYLSHGIVLASFEQLWTRAIPGDGPARMVAFSLSAITLASIAGILVYHSVERPIIRKLSKFNIGQKSLKPTTMV